MKILSIETSCDETGVSVLEGDVTSGNEIRTLGNALASQVELHAKYGGVFPAMAKRAHTEKFPVLVREVLEQAGLLSPDISKINDTTLEAIHARCSHEVGLAEALIALAETFAAPDVDYIAVTSGPGLEPALWVGINAALALGALWNKPVYPINHMEGHVVSAIFIPSLSSDNSKMTYRIAELQYPALSLLVSGGHTELVLIEAPLSYKKIGHTVDDAVGEAFDKVARMLELPYPGGPKISALAAEARAQNLTYDFSLPRPMLHSGNYNFSYSGLKTSVLYLLRDLEKNNPNTLQNDELKKSVALEFENAAIEVLVTKTIRALEEYHAQTLIIGGGVAANTYLREQIKEKIKDALGITVLFPTRELSTDNSVMIGMALYYQLLRGKEKSASNNVKADGNLSIDM
jgi:N6-L-threonylcarbamoyladenine synthase